MKRSNQVMLTAIFLAAVASAKAKAQEVPVGDTARVKDSLVSSADSIVSYNDSNAVYDGPDHVYVQPAPPPTYGFFRFHWVTHWRNYRYHHHHRHDARLASSNVPRNASPHANGFRSSRVPPIAVHTPVAANVPRTNGFGNTMRTTHAHAHS